MLALSGLDEEQFDSAAGIITYGKLFPKILDDFVTREDLKMALKSSNLPVTTNVSTLVNTAVQVVIPAGTGTGIGKGTGSGQGQVSPIYLGDYASPGSQLLKQRREAEKQAGTTLVEGFTSGIEAVADGGQ